MGPLLDPAEELDLGVEAVGVPVAKAFMYSVCGGIDPQDCVPVCIDIGTNNKHLLDSPFYVGLKQRRTNRESYLGLMDEFLSAVKECVFLVCRTIQWMLD